MVEQPDTLKPEEDKERPPFFKKMMGHKPLILILGLLFLLTVGAGSLFFFAPGYLPEGLPSIGAKRPSTEGKKDFSQKPGFIYDLDPFIVNLAETESPRYLKIRINLETHEAKENVEFKKMSPQLRDAILTFLSSKTYREIYHSEGKKQLKEEILKRANQLPAELKVKKVYFIEFVVQ